MKGRLPAVAFYSKATGQVIDLERVVMGGPSLQVAAQRAGKCSSCIVPARWARKDETPQQLLADPTFIASLPDSAKELGTHLCLGCCERLASILPGPRAAELRAKLATVVRS